MQINYNAKEIEMLFEKFFDAFLGHACSGTMQKKSCYRKKLFLLSLRFKSFTIIWARKKISLVPSGIPLTTSGKRIFFKVQIQAKFKYSNLKVNTKCLILVNITQSLQKNPLKTFTWAMRCSILVSIIDTGMAFSYS